MLRMCVVCFVAGLALSGCRSAAQIQDEQAAKCRSFGANPGTQVYVDCMLRLEEIDAADRRVDYAPRTCQKFGNTASCF